MVWYIIGAAAAILTTFGFVPQILKMCKTKSVEDVSGLTFIQFGTGVSLWVLYGIHLRDPIIICANAISLATILTALILYLRLRKPSGQ